MTVALEGTARPRPTDGSAVNRGFLSRLARGAAIALVLQALGGGFAYLLQIAFARWMGITRFGTYNYVVAWATIIAVPAGLGFPLSVLRFVPQYRSVGDHARVRGLVRATRAITVLAGFLFAIAAVLVALVVSPQGEPHLLTLLILGALLIPLGALVSLDSAIIRAGGAILGAYGPSLVGRPAATLLLGSAVWFTTGYLSADTGLVITAGVMLAVVAVQSTLVRKVLAAAPRTIGAIYERRVWLRVSAPLLLVVSLQVALSQTDFVVVGAIRGVRQAAIYLAAAKTALLVAYVYAAVTAVSAPLFAQLYAQNDRVGLQRLVAASAQWVFWPTLLIGMLLALLAPLVLGLFGSEFASGHWVLVILLFGQVVGAGCGAVGYLLSMTGHQADEARVSAITAVLNVVLCAAGAHYLGVIGAAGGTTISVILWNLWLHRIARERIGIRASIVSALALRHQPATVPPRVS